MCTWSVTLILKENGNEDVIEGKQTEEVIWEFKYITRTQQQRPEPKIIIIASCVAIRSLPESPTATLT